MAISGISAASHYHASSAQVSPTSGHHRQTGHHAKSISNVDAQSSSVVSVPTSTGRTSSKIDVTA